MTDSQPETSEAHDMRSGEVRLDAPIVAVTAFPDRARVTRRGRVRLSAGEHRVTLEHLPMALQPDSVRVAGTGAATVLGVDVVKRFPPQTTDETTQRMEAELREARTRLAALDDEDAVALERLQFYGGLAQRATRTFAGALAAGETDPVRVAELADALGAQQSEVREQRRAMAQRRERVADEIDAQERALDARRATRDPDFLAVNVGLLVATEATVPEVGVSEVTVELEVSYVVEGARWHSAYDLRLQAQALTLTWFGLVAQHTGEDWPECDLRLSTARPSGAARVPELEPWFLDRVRPVPMPPPALARGAATLGFGVQGVGAEAVGASRAMSFDAAVPLEESVATVEQGATAATYRPSRPVAVPADGGAHRATVAVVELEATLDYITAPVRAAEAHLRATVINTSTHTLPEAKASVFHGADFVGTARLDVWAPGEEVELALGVDDRIRVERELVARSATKAGFGMAAGLGKTAGFGMAAMLGTARRRDAEHRIRVENHTPTRARVTVLDQLPVSRDEGIVVKQQRLDPAPTERTEMGVLTWVLELEPGESRDIHLGVRVEAARGVEVLGWRE